MKVENKTIIITDPCYISHSDDFFEKSHEFERMDLVGFTEYLCDSTIYGDWSCTTYQIKEDPIEWLKPQESGYNIEIGKFCADSGMVFVGILEEVLKVNPDFAKWALKHKWCSTTIPNFTGEIDLYDDKNGDRHVIGKGNINFVTVQTDL